jgi:hypothetical protein
VGRGRTDGSRGAFGNLECDLRRYWREDSLGAVQSVKTTANLKIDNVTVRDGFINQLTGMAISSRRPPRTSLQRLVSSPGYREEPDRNCEMADGHRRRCGHFRSGLSL